MFDQILCRSFFPISSLSCSVRTKPAGLFTGSLFELMH
uniref:Uncharacterized protein n=1 Tax=Klebsiella pneumoniae TaxID=573 RepID=A0A8B0SZN3_KLEPN|nr:hypothetical protein [Klebsiella pneumoniae]